MNLTTRWNSLGLRAGALLVTLGWLAACGTEAEDVEDTDTGADVGDTGGDTGTDTDTGGLCDSPNPAGCNATGCPVDTQCLPTGAEGCMSSACSCEEATGTWACTADCGPVVACVSVMPQPCSEPDPRGCAVLGCPRGEGCRESGTRDCRPSECMCDAETGTWSCTDDCLPSLACFPDNPPPQACLAPHPRGCQEEGCPDNGTECVATDLPGCMPSSCDCDLEFGEWVCTEDCGPVYACVAPSPPEPTECSTPNPAGCPVTGCPLGQACVVSGDDGCQPSSCECDAERDSWACTRDCLAMHECQPIEVEPTACADPNPAGCRVTGCEYWQQCVETALTVCRPSSCGCDEDTGEWICTEDCLSDVACADLPD